MEKAQQQTEKELGEIKELLALLERELGELNVQYTAAQSELDALQKEAGMSSTSSVLTQY